MFSICESPLNGKKQIMWPDHCIQGGWGSEFPDDLVVKDTDINVFKGENHSVDSPSGFGNSSEGDDTGLE